MATTESPEASTPNSQPNIVADAEDFLRERSDLLVQYEESNQGMTFVARTSDDRRAQIEDFPKNFSKHTFIHYRTVLRDFLDVVDVTDLSDVTPREISRFAKEMQRDDLARTTRDKKL
ncbi:MAG: site-specific integrase, partial [Halorientalis sp.]